MPRIIVDRQDVRKRMAGGKNDMRMTQRTFRPPENIHTLQGHGYSQDKADFGGRREMQFGRLNSVLPAQEYPKPCGCGYSCRAKELR